MTQRACVRWIASGASRSDYPAARAAMGYFRRKPRRIAERAFKEAQRLGLPCTTVLTGARVHHDYTFVRLAAPEWHWDSGSGRGIFRVLRALRKGRPMTREQYRVLDRENIWFCRFLD